MQDAPVYDTARRSPHGDRRVRIDSPSEAQKLTVLSAPTTKLARMVGVMNAAFFP